MNQNHRLLHGMSVVLGAMLVLVVAGYAYAQTQDFLNGSFTEQIRSIAARVDRIEAILNYILGATIVSIISHLVQIRYQIVQTKTIQQGRSRILPPNGSSE